MDTVEAAIRLTEAAQLLVRAGRLDEASIVLSALALATTKHPSANWVAAQLAKTCLDAALKISTEALPDINRA